jgi:hypothetical protein
MLSRRHFLENTALGASVAGFASLSGCNSTQSVSKATISDIPLTAVERRLYEMIATYPIDDTHCHPIAEIDAHTTPERFLERISLAAFPARAYFPSGALQQWRDGSESIKERLDKEHGISDVLAKIRHHFSETVFVKFMIKEMADVLDCEPRLEEVIEARNERGKNYWKYVHDLFQDVKFENVMTDTGCCDGIRQSGLEAFQEAIGPTQVRCLARLETIQRDLLREDISFDELVDHFSSRVRDALDGTGNYGQRSYGLKSYILPGIGVIRPCYDAGVAAQSWENYKTTRNTRESNREVRARRGKELREYLLTVALEECLSRDVPMQFHCGDGEAPGVILRNQDPFYLEEIVRFDKDGMMRLPKIIPVHAGYPLVGEAAWLSHLYTNCYFEISLMNPFIHQGLLVKFLEAMEVVPLSKILFGTDAYHVPEIYWLGGKWGKRFLSQALAVYVEQRMLTEEEALETARMILHKNNRAIYNLS